ncbi:MAG: diphthamide synthesis protein [Candidatus Woesearchaeota archaeon]
MEYELELDRVSKYIRKHKAKTVCIQLPDGLKPKADAIQKELEEKTNALILIWGGSCYGACDLPNIEQLGVDILIQFGHSEWQ